MRQILLGLFLFFNAAGALQQTLRSAGPAQQPSVSPPPELARVLTDYERAWSKRDSAGLAQLFAEDGFVLPRENPAVRGRAAIGRFYSGPGGPLSLRAIAFATEGNVGYIIGGYSDRLGVKDDGKFTLTLRKSASGRWLIVSDMDNGNAPLPKCR